jgi:hypothetical protein
MKRVALVVLLVASVVLSAAPVAALTSNPEIQTVVASPTIQPGGTNHVSFQLLNDGTGAEDETRDAYNVHIRPANTVGPIEVDTNHLYVASLPDGAPASLSLSLDVPSNIDSGTYRVPLRLSYEYNNGAGGDVERKTTVSLPVRVERGPQFDVVDTDSSAPVGGSGTLEVTIRNVGTSAAYDSTLSLSASSPSVSLGSSDSSTRFVDTWERGENRTFEFETALRDSAATGNYSLSAQIDFEKPGGTTGSTPSLAVPLHALPETTFDVSNVSRSLQVDENGTVSLTLRNDGPVSVADATVTLRSPHSAIRVAGSANATRFVGYWAPGERRTVTYEVRATAAAEPQNYSLPVSVAYRGADGDYATDRIGPIGVTPAPEQPTFAVEPMNTTLGIDSTNAVRVRVRNVGNERLTDVHAHLAVDAPYESNNPTSYVASLPPGESVTMTFEVTTPEDGVPTRDAIPLTVTADTPDDERITSDRYFVPITITNAGGTTRLLSTVGVGAVALAVLGGAWWWYER